MTKHGLRDLWKRFEDATAARDKGELKESVRLLRELLDVAPSSERDLLTATYQQLGYILGSLEQPSDAEAAVACFAKAVEMSPRSELSSLGLFHALDDAGRHDDALAEGVRYLALRASDDYRAMFNAELGDEVTERGRELISQGRAHLARWEQERGRPDPG